MQHQLFPRRSFFIALGTREYRRALIIPQIKGRRLHRVTKKMKFIGTRFLQLNLVPPPVILEDDLSLHNVSNRMCYRGINRVCLLVGLKLNRFTNEKITALWRTISISALHCKLTRINASCINIINTILGGCVGNRRIPPPVNLIVVE